MTQKWSWNRPLLFIKASVCTSCLLHCLHPVMHCKGWMHLERLCSDNNSNTFFFLTWIHWICKTGTVKRFIFFFFFFISVCSICDNPHVKKKYLNMFKTSLKCAMSRKKLFQYHQTIFSYPYALIIAVNLVSNFSFRVKSLYNILIVFCRPAVMGSNRPGKTNSTLRCTDIRQFNFFAILKSSGCSTK